MWESRQPLYLIVLPLPILVFAASSRRPLELLSPEHDILQSQWNFCKSISFNEIGKSWLLRRILFLPSFLVLMFISFAAYQDARSPLTSQRYNSHGQASLPPRRSKACLSFTLPPTTSSIYSKWCDSRKRIGNYDRTSRLYLQLNISFKYPLCICILRRQFVGIRTIFLHYRACRHV